MNKAGGVWETQSKKYGQVQFLPRLIGGMIMSGSFEIDGDQITIVFEYAVNLAKGQQTITDAAHGLWDRGAGDHGDEENPIVFDDLSNQQKLDLVDAYVKQKVLGVASRYITNVARVQAWQDAEDSHEL